MRRIVRLIVGCLLLGACASTSTELTGAAGDTTTVNPTTTTTAAPTTTTTTTAAPTTTTIRVVQYDRSDPAPYLAAIDAFEQQVGVVWPVSRGEGYDAATAVCRKVSTTDSIDDLTADVRSRWADEDEPTQESWESLKHFYTMLTIFYCPQWDATAAAIGDTSAETEEWYREVMSDVNANFMADLLAGQHPRSAALVIRHMNMPTSDYVTGQLVYLMDTYPTEAAAIGAEFCDLIWLAVDRTRDCYSVTPTG